MTTGIAKVISTEWDAVKRLVVKVLYRGKLIAGKGDVRTPPEVSPYGMDSNPVKGKVALYMKTLVDGRYYVVGYLNTQRLASPGEARIFSTDSSGEFKFNLWLRDDGTGLIGHSADPAAYTNYLTKFNELAVEFNKLKADYNALVAVVNANAALLGTHTHVVSNAVPAAPGPVTATPSGVPGQNGSLNTSNIDTCKHDKIKTL